MLIRQVVGCVVMCCYVASMGKDLDAMLGISLFMLNFAL